jgi:hypothetical protein
VARRPRGRRTRLIKDIAREQSAPDRMMMLAYLCIRPVFVPAALNLQDLDSYAASWRSVLVKGLREYKAAAVYCAKAIRARRHAEAHFLAKKGGHPRSTATINKAHAHRAWRRNAERMARH